MSGATEELNFSFYSILSTLHLNRNLWRVATALGSAGKGSHARPQLVPRRAAGQGGSLVETRRGARYVLHLRSHFSRSKLLPNRSRSERTPRTIARPRAPGWEQPGSSTRGRRRHVCLLPSTLSFPSPATLSPSGKWGGDPQDPLGASRRFRLLYSSPRTWDAQHLHFTDEKLRAPGAKPRRSCFGALGMPKTLSWVALSGRAGKAARKYLGL